jgi:DNA modification methylase
MIPFRFAIEMQNRGWILRNVIIWHKNNCMPCSVKDRFTVDFEYLFFFVKNKKYFFETQYEPIKTETIQRNKYGLTPKKRVGACGTDRKSGSFASRMPPIGGKKQTEGNFNDTYSGNTPEWNELGRNKRTVWTINTKPFKEAHFAVYPEALCEIPIKSGCPEFVCNKCGKPREKIIESDWKEKREGTWKEAENSGKEMQRTNTHRQTMAGGLLQIKEPSNIKFIGYSSCGCNSGFSGGIVLDPFLGSGTTGLVALKQNKNFIGIELNEKYISIAKNRLKKYLEQTKIC